MFKVAIIGRPNVGKSTLFNKFVGKHFALTDDLPGVTRDRKEARANLGPLKFLAIDTAGLESEANRESLERRMYEQTETAVMDADLCLFMVDGKTGITQKDKTLADLMRKKDKKILLVVNKFEGKNEEVLGKEFYRLGFGEPVAISAEHREGFNELYDRMAPFFEEYEKNFAEFEVDNRDEKALLQIAIVGRPNAGKSTFLNQILNEERMITGPEAGITRDAIAIDHEFMGQKIRFIDTAGIRKKANVSDKLEKLSLSDSFRAIKFAQVVILLIDAGSLLDKQDMAIAGQVLQEGRGLVFAINKIDLVKGDKENFLREVRKQIQSLFAEVDGAPIIGVSAKSGYNVVKTLEYALKVYQQWQTYLPTSKLHTWLDGVVKGHAPKLMKGRETKLKYITQIKKRPPTFAVFTNNIKALQGSYERYLVNCLREDFDLKLTPVRLVLRKSENPFSERKEKTFSKKTHKPKKK